MKVCLTTWLIFLILGAVSAGRRDDDDYDDADDVDEDPREFENRRSRDRGYPYPHKTVIVPEDSQIIIIRDRKRPNFERDRYEDDYDSTDTRDYGNRRRSNYDDRRSSGRGRAPVQGKFNPNRKNGKGMKQGTLESASPPLNAKKSSDGSNAKKSSDKAGTGGLSDILKIGG